MDNMSSGEKRFVIIFAIWVVYLFIFLIMWMGLWGTHMIVGGRFMWVYYTGIPVGASVIILLARHTYWICMKLVSRFKKRKETRPDDTTGE